MTEKSNAPLKKYSSNAKKKANQFNSNHKSSNHQSSQTSHSLEDQKAGGLSLIQWCFGFFILTMPLLFCKWNDQSPFEMIKAYYSAEFVGLLFIFWILKIGFQQKEDLTIKVNLWLWGLLYFLFVFLLSFIFSNDYYSSIWGVLNLPAGSVKTVLTFMIFSFLVTQFFHHKRHVILLINCFVLVAFIMSLYGIVQHFGGDPINWWVYDAMSTRALSTMGQSVGFGTVVGCALPLAFVKILTSKEKNKIIFWSLVWLSLNLGLLYCGSRLPILAFIATILIFLGFLIVFKNKIPNFSFKKVGLAFAVLALSSAIYYFEPVEKSLVQKLEVSQIQGGYKARFVTWGTAFNIFKKYPVLGTGPEVFGEEFNHIQTVEQNYVESWNLIWHKAHNEFIHNLATLGVVGFSGYLALILLMFYSVFWILKQKIWFEHYLYNIGLLGGFGYLLVTHLTAFSFIPTLMVFYLFPALSFLLIGQNKDCVINSNLFQKIRRYLSVGLAIPVLVAMVIIYRVWQADIDYNDSRRSLIGTGQVDLAANYLSQAIENNPWNAEYYCFKADVNYNYLMRMVRQQGPQAEAMKKYYWDETLKASDECVAIDDQKSDLWRARGTLMMSLAQFNRELIAKSLQAFRQAIVVYPNNPFNYVSEGNVLRMMGQFDAAEVSYFIALQKKNDFTQAFAELLNLYYFQKNNQKISDLIEKMKSGRTLSENFKIEAKGLLKIMQDNKDNENFTKLSQLIL